MAIGKGIDAPYVHSSYSNFQDRGGTLLKSNRETKEQERIKLANQLKSVRNQLKEATDTFLGDMSVAELSKEIFDQDKTYSKIGFRIIQEMGANKALLESVPKIDATKLLNRASVEFQRELQTMVNQSTNTIDITSVLDAVIKSLNRQRFFIDLSGETYSQAASRQTNIGINTFGRNTFGGNLFNNTYLAKEIFKGKKFTKPDLLKRRFKETFLKATTLHATNRLAKEAGEILYNYFEKRWKEIVQSDKPPVFSYKNDDPAQTEAAYLERVKKGFEEKMKEYYHTQADASGALGEIATEVLVNADPSQDVSIRVIASLSEEEVRKDALHPEIQSDFIDLTKFSSKNVQSYSDYWLKKGEHSVRVQAKNYMAAGDAFFRRKKKGDFKMPVTIESGGLMLDLIKDLENRKAGVFEAYDANELSYIVANEVFFHMRAARDTGKKRPFHTEDIMKELGYAISNLLGVMAVETIDVNTNVNISTSNIFYAINNRVLVPTYEVIDRFIELLEGELEKMETISISPIWSGIDFTPVYAKVFYRWKKEAVTGQREWGGATKSTAGGLAKGDERYSEPLLSVGTAMGQSIMASFSVTGVKLNVNLDAVFSSAYTFTFS